MVALFLLASATPGGTAGRADPEALRFREDMGLSTDAGLMAALSADPAADRQFGPPLAPQEIAEIIRRSKVELGLGKLKAKIADLPEYAGLYIDQRSGGEVVLQVTSLEGVDLNVLNSLMPPTGTLRLEHADHTFKALLDVYERASAEAPALRQSGLEIRTISLDVMGNKVSFGLGQHSSRDMDLLSERYGRDMISVRHEAEVSPASCTRSACSDRLRGGLKVTVRGKTSTSSYVAKYAGNVYLIISGHPGEAAPIGTHVYHNGTSIGKITKTAYRSGSRADAKAVDIADSLKSNLILVGTVSLQVTSVHQNPTVNMFVCHSGITTGVSCGRVKALSESVFYGAPYGDVHLIHQARADYWNKSGDSGAPVYVSVGSDKAVATGIHSSTAGHFSHQYYVEFDLLIDTCLTMSC